MPIIIKTGYNQAGRQDTPHDDPTQHDVRCLGKYKRQEKLLISLGNISKEVRKWPRTGRKPPDDC
jgi:hypothetical protein